MRQEPWDSPGPHEDQVRFGSSREPRPQHPVVRYLVVVLVVAVAVTVAITTHGHTQNRAAGSGKSPGDQWYAASSSTAVKALGHPLLGENPGWELIAAGTGAEPGSDGAAVLVRIQFAVGLITRTRLPPLQSKAAQHGWSAAARAPVAASTPSSTRTPVSAISCPARLT